MKVQRDGESRKDSSGTPPPSSQPCAPTSPERLVLPSNAWHSAALFPEPTQRPPMTPPGPAQWVGLRRAGKDPVLGIEPWVRHPRPAVSEGTWARGPHVDLLVMAQRPWRLSFQDTQLMTTHCLLDPKG